jgi:2-hydroxy-6-oxonona-2,4-dienedioate hydrolase
VAAEEPVSLGEAAAAWAGSRRVEVGGRWVRYREAGRGCTVVLVHGLAMSADYWHRTAPAVAAAGFRVLAPDLPGYGRTEGPEEGLGVSRQAWELLRWAEAVGLGRAVYLGHSLSCQTVLELACRSPDLVSALVLVAPTGDEARGRLGRLAHQAWGLTRDAWREPWELLAVAAQSYLRTGALRFLRTWRLGAYHDLHPLLPRVEAPVLVVVGTRDPVVPREFAEGIAAALERGRLAVVEDGTHAVFFSRPGPFNEVLSGFLRETCGPPSA